MEILPFQWSELFVVLINKIMSKTKLTKYKKKILKPFSNSPFYLKALTKYYIYNLKVWFGCNIKRWSTVQVKGFISNCTTTIANAPGNSSFYASTGTWFSDPIVLSNPEDIKSWIQNLFPYFLLFLTLKK